MLIIAEVVFHITSYRSVTSMKHLGTEGLSPRASRSFRVNWLMSFELVACSPNDL